MFLQTWEVLMVTFWRFSKAIRSNRLRSQQRISICHCASYVLQGPVKVGQGCSTQNLITFGSPIISKKAPSTRASACQIQPGSVSSKQTTQESASCTPQQNKVIHPAQGVQCVLKNSIDNRFNEK